MREKPFIATLIDPTRSFIQGTAGNEFYRLERNQPQRVSAAVAAALRETLYEVTVTGDEPATAQIAENKQQESKEATDGNAGADNSTENNGTGEGNEEAGGEEENSEAADSSTESTENNG